MRFLRISIFSLFLWISVPEETASLNTNDSGKQSLVPLLALNTSLSSVWHLLDTESPKATVSLSLQSSLTLGDVNDIILPFFNGFEDIGYSCNMQDEYAKLQLRCSGNNDKWDVVLRDILDLLVNCDFQRIDPKWFQKFKARHLQAVKNGQRQEARDIAEFYVEMASRSFKYTQDDFIPATENVTIQTLTEAGQKLFSRLKMQWLFYGNISSEESSKIATTYEDTLRKKFDAKPMLTSVISPTRRYILLPEGANLVYEMETSSDSSSAVASFYQIGLTKEPKLYVMGRILHKLSIAWFGSYQNSKQEFGYKVEQSIRSYGPTTGVLFQAYGQTHPANMSHKLQEEIRSFVNETIGVREETFNETKASIALLLENWLPTTFRQKLNTFWDQITSQQFDFEQNSRQINELRNLTLGHFQQFVEDYFTLNGRKRRTVLVTVLSVAEGGAGYT